VLIFVLCLFLFYCIVYSGLKKSPNIELSENIIVTVSPSGSIDQHLMIDYIERVIVPYTSGQPALLVFDACRAHLTSSVQEALILHNINHVKIPSGFTNCLQPLDVSINKPLKTEFRTLWSRWMLESPAEYTKCGNRKRPDYKTTMNMIHLSACRLRKESIIASFTACGLCTENLTGIK
jgi:hypothetical protein